MFDSSHLNITLGIHIFNSQSVCYLYADIKHILTEAQNRWLRPAEICEILRNYQKFQIASEPPNRPISMILVNLTKKWK